MWMQSPCQYTNRIVRSNGFLDVGPFFGRDPRVNSRRVIHKEPKSEAPYTSKYAYKNKHDFGLICSYFLI